MARLFSEDSDEWRDIEAALYGADYRRRQERRRLKPAAALAN
jgi:hypothetical protein